MTELTGLSDQELEELFLAHLEIKRQLKKIVRHEEVANEENVRADDLCNLGRWIYGKGTRFSHLRGYQLLKDAHAAFHEEAYNALKLYNNNLFDEALTYIETGPFEVRSLEIKRAFFEMRFEQDKDG